MHVKLKTNFQKFDSRLTLATHFKKRSQVKKSKIKLIKEAKHFEIKYLKISMNGKCRENSEQRI